MADDHSRLSLDTVLCPAEGLDFVLVSDNELLVQFGTRSRPSELFRDNDLSGAIGSVVRALQSGSSTLGEVLLSLPHEQRDEARQLIDSLVEQGVISEAARDPVQQYIRYTFTGESSISGSRVALIGAGPIGARIARNLLQQGIARLWLADSRLTDTIWQGSALFGAPQPADLGRPAQMVLAEHLRPGRENVEALEWADGSAVEAGVANADLVVLALEQPDMQLSHAVNRACIGAGKPWLSAVIDGNRGLIGPLFSRPTQPVTTTTNCWPAPPCRAGQWPASIASMFWRAAVRRSPSAFPAMPISWPAIARSRLRIFSFAAPAICSAAS